MKNDTRYTPGVIVTFTILYDVSNNKDINLLKY